MTMRCLSCRRRIAHGVGCLAAFSLFLLVDVRFPTASAATPEGVQSFDGADKNHGLPAPGADAARENVCGASPSKDTPNGSPAYRNPVYEGSMPDPSVIQHRGVYYAFGTTGRSRKADGRIFTLLRSTDLVHWEERGGALVPPFADPLYEYWAPEVVESEGRFYLYYSVGGIEPERFAMRVAESDQPEGPYEDCGVVLADSENKRFAIDPFPFRDDDGRWYLFYSCNYPFVSPGKHPGTGIKVDRLVGMKRLAGEGREVVRPVHEWTLYEAHRRMEVYGRTFDWHTIEGPCVVKHGGKYYCFYSGATWQTARYGVDFVVADHPMGPYSGPGDRARVLHGIPDKVRGPGHHSLVRSPDGLLDILVYHAWDPEMRIRQLCIDPLVWAPDGPRCDGPSYAPRRLSIHQ